MLNGMFDACMVVGGKFNLVNNMMLSCEFHADSLIRDLSVSYSAPSACISGQWSVRAVR